MLSRFDEWMLQNDPELVEALGGWRGLAALGALGLAGLTSGCKDGKCENPNAPQANPTAVASARTPQRAVPANKQIQSKRVTIDDDGTTNVTYPDDSGSGGLQDKRVIIDDDDGPSVSSGGSQSPSAAPVEGSGVKIKGDTFEAVGVARVSTVLGKQKGMDMARKKAVQDAQRKVLKALGVDNANFSQVQTVDSQVQGKILKITIRGKVQ